MKDEASWQLEPSETNGERVTIRDVGPHDRYKTITNAAAYTVRTLAGMLRGRRLFYYDSDGNLAELLHDDAGNFLGFSPLLNGPIGERATGGRDADGNRLCASDETDMRETSFPPSLPPAGVVCTNCNALIADKSKFCSYCGTELQPPPGSALPFKYAQDVLVDSRAIVACANLLDRINDFMSGFGFDEKLVAYIPLTCLVTSANRELSPAELIILHVETCKGFDRISEKTGHTFKVEKPRLLE